MGANTISAAGVPLPPPQSLYPVTINNTPVVVGTNRISLPPGGDLLIPSGTWAVTVGKYSSIQVLDPVTQTWGAITTIGNAPEVTLNSDGTNYRLVNPTGFPVGALISSGGAGYTSAPTITPSIGSSVWLGIVGGGVSQLNCTSGGSGANYSVPPLVHIAAPPAPGVQATAVAAISGGAVSSFTIVNPGAGYGTTAPTVTIVPQATDRNIASTSTTRVTNATATAQLSFVGQLTAALLLDEGTQPLTSVPALTCTGGGASSQATATAVMAFAVTGVTVTTGGSGYGSTAVLRALGGTITSSAATSNSASVSSDLVQNRDCTITAVTGSGTGLQAGVIIDGGLFAAPPTLYATPGVAGAAASALAVFGVTVGGQNDTSFITPL